MLRTKRKRLVLQKLPHANLRLGGETIRVLTPESLNVVGALGECDTATLHSRNEPSCAG